MLKHFDRYLQAGYYPYCKEAREDYHMRVREVVNLVIDSDMPDSYLALDDIETGSGNRIPLWMFGMMY